MKTGNEPNENFGWGGPWTEKKLDAFIKYVKAYLTIMNKNPQYTTIYFDGLAGSGERKFAENPELLKLIEVTEDDESVYQGAAERLIRLEQPYDFDFYYFIDKEQSSVQNLREKLEALPNAQDRTLEFRVGDCNGEVLKLAAALQNRRYAALIFLDPFGMQIDWETIATLQGTRSDVWILVPTGVIVNRLLDRKGDLKFGKKLETFFGMNEEEIRVRFYQKRETIDLFGEQTDQVVKVMKPIQKIAETYVENLNKIWKYVTPKPLVLKNRKGTPIFHFLFASNNQAAVRIANYIIEKG